MGKLRKRVESALATTLEGPFGLPIVLIAPDGSSAEYQGRIDYETVEWSERANADIISDKICVTLRRSSLSRIPLEGETWFVRIPEVPDEDANKITLKWDGLSTNVGRSIGYIKLYLHHVEHVDFVEP